MKENRFSVPTRVLISQGQAILSQLGAPANAARLQALAGFGIVGQKLAGELQEALAKLIAAKTEQERTKGDYLSETKSDQTLAESGYRWKQRLDARVRVYIAEHGDAEDLAGQFRFGKLPAPRARGVLSELRVVLPEAQEYAEKLAPYGVTAAFIAEGQAIADALGGAKESDSVLAERKVRTKAVHHAEVKLAQLLDRLRAADEAYAIDEPAEGTLFRLDLIRAEQARVRAAREAAQAARGEDGKDDGDAG